MLDQGVTRSVFRYVSNHRTIEVAYLIDGKSNSSYRRGIDSIIRLVRRG